MRDKKELERYVEGYERDENAPPDMRGNGNGQTQPRGGRKKQSKTGRRPQRSSSAAREARR
jgi:hypothetical protein